MSDIWTGFCRVEEEKEFGGGLAVWGGRNRAEGGEEDGCGGERGGGEKQTGQRPKWDFDRGKRLLTSVNSLFRELTGSLSSSSSLSLSAVAIFSAALRQILATPDRETSAKLFHFFYSTKPSPYITHATQFNGDQIQGCFTVFFIFRRAPTATVTTFFHCESLMRLSSASISFPTSSLSPGDKNENKRRLEGLLSLCWRKPKPRIRQGRACMVGGGVWRQTRRVIMRTALKVDAHRFSSLSPLHSSPNVLQTSLIHALKWTVNIPGAL
ncbi:hypothetical protein ACLB2K_069627 [Fragaria x ananassa]